MAAYEPSVVYQGAHVRIGRFRAAPADPWFVDSGPARGYLAVFPRTAVTIRPAGARPVVADPTRVLFYNLHQEYRRATLAPDGDRCEWFAFDPADVVEATRPHDPSVAERPRRPFALQSGPSDARTYAAQRLIYQAACRGSGVEALLVEEASLLLLERVIDRAYTPDALRADRHALARRAHADLADAVRATLAARYAAPMSLGQLAASVGVSAFHLCRVFRAQTGRTIHRHREALRIHASLEQVAGGATDLTEVALEVGYSSHSHFTHAFRRAVGLPPSGVRRLAASGSRAQVLELLRRASARARS